MRAALAIAAALSLAACRVDVEGAPCDRPGSADQCPSGQACGVDGKCSERATQCMAAALRCTPGVDTRCSADFKRIETCTTSDPCGAWQVVDVADDCSATKLVCDGAGASASCVCAAPQAEILVDVAAEVGSVAPTGASEPPACRFKTLGAALSYAQQVWQPANAGAPVTVRALGSPTVDAPVTFESESFPLRIAPGVTLAAGGPAAADWVIAASPADGRDVVELQAGGTLEGFTIRGSAPATGYGIEVVCGSGVNATVNRVIVDGGNAFTRGVSVEGACGLGATDLRIAHVAGSGVYIDAALASASVPDVGARIDLGLIEDCAGAGAEVRGGELELNQVVALRNAGFGVKAATREDAPKRAIALELNDSIFQDNGEAGLLVRALEAGSSVEIRRSWFSRNKATTAQDTEFTTGRRAGGIFLDSNPPATLAFEGNRIYGNANADAGIVVDQLVTLSGESWNLSAPACGASANVFACPGNGQFVYAFGEMAAVTNAYWPPGASWPARSLVTNADVVPPCEMDPAPIPACPP